MAGNGRSKSDIRRAKSTIRRTVNKFRKEFQAWERKFLPLLDKSESATADLLAAIAGFRPELQRLPMFEMMRHQLFAMKNQARQFKKTHGTMRRKFDQIAAQITAQDLSALNRMLSAQTKLLANCMSQYRKLDALMNKIVHRDNH